MTVVVALRYKDGIVMAADHQLVAGDTVCHVADSKISISKNKLYGVSYDRCNLLGDIEQNVINNQISNNSLCDINCTKLNAEIIKLSKKRSNKGDAVEILVAENNSSYPFLLIRHPANRKVERLRSNISFWAIGTGGEKAINWLNRQDVRPIEIDENKAVQLTCDAILSGCSDVVGVGVRPGIPPDVFVIENNNPPRKANEMLLNRIKDIFDSEKLIQELTVKKDRYNHELPKIS